MGIAEMFVLAGCLAMDAFTVSICKGLTLKRMDGRKAVLAGLYFGGFQAIMPVLGYFMGIQFYRYIQTFDHWITFILLSVIGFNMIKESRYQECDVENSEDFSPRTMIPLGIATSVDALAMGVTFAFVKINIVVSILIIGVMTFFVCTAGILIGYIFGARFKSKAELTGGLVLWALGLKIMLEHLLRQQF